MFLGRSTIQWMAVVTAALQFGATLFPQVQPAVWTGLTGLCAVIIALVAQTSTTPVATPIVPAGTTVTVTDPAGSTQKVTV